MTGLSAIGRARPGVAAGAKRPAAAGGFKVGDATEIPVAAGTAAASPIGGMLALQEVPDPAVRERSARRHGETMLELLAALQRARLGGADGGQAALADIAAAVAAAPDTADPALRGVLAAITLRVRIELARQ